MNGKYELNEKELDAVTGGTGEPAAPTPTDSVTYTCPHCGTDIHASARDEYVTCPNVSCRQQYLVKEGWWLEPTRMAPKPPRAAAGK